MKKRIITISAIVVGVLIIGWFCIFILLPRVMLYNMINKLPNIDRNVDYFTNFSVTNSDMQTIDNGYVSVKIPAGFAYNNEKTELTPYLYNTTDGKEKIYFMKEPGDSSSMNLLKPEIFEDIEDIPKELGIKEITEGFESLSSGIVPDSAYNTYKCALLADKDDYSFWDLKKSTCFAIAAVLREAVIPVYDETFLYETEEICGIIYITHDHGKNKQEYVIFEIFNVNDLNTVHTLIMDVNSIADAYAIINSAKFI